MISNRPIRPLALVAATAFVAACGGNTPTTAPATVAAATQAPVVTTAPASIEPGFSFVVPSGFNADTELEGILPDDLGGVAIQKLSMTGDQFMGTGQGTEDMEAVLKALGKSPSDLSVAFGGNAAVVMIAFRVKGVEANTIYQAVVAAQQQDAANISDVTIAGKSAKKILDSTSTTAYLYLTGDALVTVTGVGAGLTDTLLNEIFSKLP